ncbi:molybdenum cofactor guanylyltransferase [Ferdinandcohnia sp. Marseille-Q9671]
MKKQNIMGIILAGGESRRFGSPKAFATLHNKYFFEYAIDALQGNVDNINIVSHPRLINQFQKHVTLKIVQDVPQFQGYGPLAGLITAMKEDKADWYVVLPCDTPFVTNNLVKQLISYTTNKDIDAVVPVIDGRKQPLVAIYHSRVAQRIEELLFEKRFKLSFLLDSCNVRYVTNDNLELQGLEFENINNKEEYEKAKQRPNDSR